MLKTIADQISEGLWVPLLSIGGSSAGITYFKQIGQYQRIGNRVQVTGRVYVDSPGTNVGAAIITGLPFVAAGASDYDNSPTFSVNFFVDFWQGVLPQGRIDGGGSEIKLFQNTAGGIVPIDRANFAKYTTISFSANYLTA